MRCNAVMIAETGVCGSVRWGRSKVKRRARSATETMTRSLTQEGSEKNKGGKVLAIATTGPAVS